jgi:hypothetical protein
MGTTSLTLERAWGVMTTGDSEPNLSAFQLEVARLFFALPASQGFLLAGGAALLAQHLTARPTEDLDFFTAPERGHVLAACDALEAGVRQRGWSVQRIQDSDSVLANMIATLNRFTDDEVPVPGGSSIAELRTFYATWRSELLAQVS